MIDNRDVAKSENLGGWGELRAPLAPLPLPISLKLRHSFIYKQRGPNVLRFLFPDNKDEDKNINLMV